ncbi:asparaginase [Halomonas cupida]|uniref:asparaginase n=1 Tax=Halomonas cupida TaxID=44933 RepID=UPI003EF2424E
MNSYHHAAVLVIYTGGTIGMVDTPHGLAPGPDMEARVRRAVDELPAQRRASLPAFEWLEVATPIDSSSAQPEDWATLAQLVAEHYLAYRGIVVLHGTDTLAWTASSLAFQLQGIDRPVVVTGSMAPLAAAESDALDNLVDALGFAAMPQLQEVAVCFAGKLLRGCRSRKWHARDSDAFTSPNAPLLGECASGQWQLHESRGLDAVQRGAPRFELGDYRGLGDKVVRIPLWPGIRPWQLAAWLDDDRVEGALLEVWGGGNVPDDPQLGAVLAEASGQGKLLVAISQCPQGTIAIGHYAAGQLLAAAEVVSGDDMTPEAAFTKLVHLLSLPLDSAQRRELFRTPLVGERG